MNKLIQEKPTTYDKALIYTETDDFDLTYFIYNQLEVVVKAIAVLKTHIDHKKQEMSDFVAWIDKSHIALNLKRGHLEILKEAVKEPGTEFTLGQVANSLRVSQSNAMSYLKKLVDEGLLIQSATKKVRTISYIAPAELKDKLQA